jgi:hypothetical protein
MLRPESPLSQFGPAFVWLLGKGVSSARLASLFGTTTANIRVIAFRARYPELQESTENSTLDALNSRPSPELAEVMGVRAAPDDVVRTPVGARKLAWLKDEIQNTVNRYSARYLFLDGIKALRRLAPWIGYAGDCRRIALSALLHQETAWFLVHSGHSGSAAREAAVAQNLWRIAFHESHDREYAHRFIQAALISSHACLLARQPKESWRILEIAREAAESIGAPLGSDHFRQRGVALFQLREDERATQQFERSTEAMERLNEAKNPAQLLMTGSRHINLLGRLKCDQAQQLSAIARLTFGDDSLEASMTLNWAAACGLSTDSPSAIQEAVELLGAHPGLAPEFGHQSTIRKLLTVTPELGLDSRLRRIWVRRALYENTSRNR